MDELVGSRATTVAKEARGKAKAAKPKFGDRTPLAQPHVDAHSMLDQHGARKYSTLRFVPNNTFGMNFRWNEC